MSRCLAFSILLLWIFGVSQSASPQTSSVSGTLTDISGAVVPRAKVSAVNQATNAARSVETDNSGAYRITNLSPGIYDVIIEAPGFKTVEYSRDRLYSLDPL